MTPEDIETSILESEDRISKLYYFGHGFLDETINFMAFGFKDSIDSTFHLLSMHYAENRLCFGENFEAKDVFFGLREKLTSDSQITLQVCSLECRSEDHKCDGNVVHEISYPDRTTEYTISYIDSSKKLRVKTVHSATFNPVITQNLAVM